MNKRQKDKTYQKPTDHAEKLCRDQGRKRRRLKEKRVNAIERGQRTEGVLGRAHKEDSYNLGGGRGRQGKRQIKAAGNSPLLKPKGKEGS